MLYFPVILNNLDQAVKKGPWKKGTKKTSKPNQKGRQSGEINSVKQN